MVTVTNLERDIKQLKSLAAKVTKGANEALKAAKAARRRSASPRRRPVSPRRRQRSPRRRQRSPRRRPRRSMNNVGHFEIAAPLEEASVRMNNLPLHKTDSCSYKNLNIR